MRRWLLALGGAARVEVGTGPRGEGVQGSPGGGWGGTRPGLQGDLGDVVQVRAAEVKVHPCCFACHVPSWLSATVCHPPVSFLRRQWKRHPERDWLPCSVLADALMLAGNEAEWVEGDQTFESI